jgi:preprotein translocase subunit SecD
LPVLAAAIVVAVTVALVLAKRESHASAQPAANGPGTFVTLRARIDGISEADLRKARQIISARAVALGAPHPDVRIVGSDEITAFLPGVPASAVKDLGAVEALQLRPIVYYPTAPFPGVPETKPSSGGASRVVDPWKSLGFAPPRDPKAFYALSPAQQRAIGAVLGHWDCTDLSLDRADAPIVTCDPDGEFRYLLGPVIATGNQIASAAPAANPEAIGYDWQLAVTLTPTGNRRLTDYLTRFSEWGRTLHRGQEPYGSQPSVADTLDGLAIARYPIKKPITDSTFGASSSTGSFNQRTATLLSDYLNAGPLPAPFDVVSIQAR